MTDKKLLKLIEARQAGVAKERDKLDAAIEELTMMKESCDRAWDALSELV